MSIYSVGHDCVGCGACASVCNKGCITMGADKEGFLYSEVNTDICVECGRCERICPVLHPVDSDAPLAYMAARTKDNDVRRNSSSGGLFYELAKPVIINGGTVWGARFNERYEVLHDKVRLLNELRILMGSKYVQSDIRHVYGEVKADLELGREVLFSGTPCQIVALKNFLPKNYDNLYTVDIACHGVPSPLVWQAYLQNLAKGKRIDYVSFREKIPGWESYSVCYRIGGESKRNLRVNDPYMCGYLEGFYTRPVCHHCPIKPNHYASDLSIADFWGINRVDSTMSDDRGTSLVAVRTKKGEELLSRANVEKKEYLYQQILPYNQSFTHISTPSPMRDTFWADVQKYGVGPMVLKYGKRLRPSWDIRLKMWIYNKLHK